LEESEESTDAEEPSNVPPARARKYEKDSNPKSDVSNIFSDGEEVVSARKARAAKVPDESDFSEDQLPGQKVNPTKLSKAVPKHSDPSHNKHALLADRVWDCKDIIDPLMDGPKGRTDIFVWTNLMDEFKVHKYNAKKLNAGTNIPPAIVNGARTGLSVHFLLNTAFKQIFFFQTRYGDQGAKIIRNTLKSMYDYRPVMTPASKPLTLESYTTYVLIPYIAASLIGEDIGTDVDGGWEEMQCGNAHETIAASNDSESGTDLDTVNEEDHKAVAITRKGKKGKENRKPTVCYSLCIVPNCVRSFILVQVSSSVKKGNADAKKTKSQAMPSASNIISMQNFPVVSADLYCFM